MIQLLGKRALCEEEKITFDVNITSVLGTSPLLLMKRGTPVDEIITAK